ncbi:MAG: hypothetical protein ACR2PL_10280 [Dehalococcoidia bacterium]
MASPSPSPVAARSYFADHRVVAYYGNPLSPILGILGDGDPEQMVVRLKQQTGAYAQIDTGRPVTAALELIEAVAQDTPTDNKLFLAYTEPEVVDRYSKLAQDNSMLLILDEQIGRSTPEAETSRLIGRLSSPHVQLALDPEFDMKPGEIPGDTLGSMDAADINQVQAMLEDVAVRNRLPSKILIIHLFQLDMLTHPDQLRSYPHVDLVLDADGFGTRSIKEEKYQALITARPAGHPGVKLFYKYDPNIWAPSDVLKLNPPPDVIIYQ